MAYDNIRLEKGMYRQSGKSFSQVLEGLDPSENYRGTSLEKTDAFQRQLRRFGIKVKGPGSSGVEKFFRTTDSAVLFPEYIARTVRQGMEENDILPAITATTTVIDAMDYRSIYAEMDEREAAPAAVAEGTVPADDNVMVNAPHTAQAVTADEWNHAYSRSAAAYPVPGLRLHKFWPSCSRVDNTYGDRNFCCTCDTLAAAQDANA